MTNANYNSYRDLLVRKLGGTNGDWRKGYVEKLINGDGVQLYDNENSNWFRRNRDKFGNTPFEDLNRYVNQLEQGKMKNMAGAFGRTLVDEAKFWESLKVWDGWKDASNLSKAGKSMGAFGTVFSIGENMVRNTNNGKVDWENFAVDTGVDVATGATATAAGAAIGSLILPPAGTVVGAVTGAAIGFMINTKWGDSDKSLVDAAKDGANKFVDNTKKKLKKGWKKLGKWFRR